MGLVIPTCFLTVSNLLNERELAEIHRLYDGDAMIDKCFSMICFCSAKRDVIESIAKYLNNIEEYRRVDPVVPSDILQL